MLSQLSRDSSKDYQQSLRVIGRFCTIVLFFTCWAAVRHWPHPLYPLSNMLRVASAACVAFALLRREAFAAASLNYWDEALGYIAAAALLDAICNLLS
jgi:putative flippase GtrA